MPDRFEVTNKDAFGRIGKLETPHGAIATPALLPVVNLNLTLIAPREMRNFGAEALMTNAYIIYRNPRLRETALSTGIHSLLGFDGPIMTDSGAFQLAEYGDIELQSEQIVAFQREAGSDIGTPIDIPTPPDVTHQRALEELEVTRGRINEALRCSGDEMLVAAPIQGSTHLDLREQYADLLSKLSADVYPIGAVVPLMESYRFSELSSIILACKAGLAWNKPVHLFGAGHPMMFALAVALGCDLFDSAAYALYARDGRYLTPGGTYKLKDLTYLPCTCPVCSSGTLALTERQLAEHNLWVSFSELRTIKQAILDGQLWELVERRCRHPSLLQALRTIQTDFASFEAIEPLKRSFIYTSSESAARPEVARYAQKLHRLDVAGRVLVTTDRRKTRHMEREFDVTLLMKAPFGPYPLELAETYPIGQSEVPAPDCVSIKSAVRNLIEFIGFNSLDVTFAYDEQWDHDVLAEVGALATLVRI
ncbi:MAG TPA: tRNA guanosine(15) transglycosylase TgtA [Candidatus Bathyarchaeia archaeon]|nr:tRNA guanosine(15) transglycosylase TgtA [Candidatus Bathyarchaeia archaeon]